MKFYSKKISKEDHNLQERQVSSRLEKVKEEYFKGLSSIKNHLDTLQFNDDTDILELIKNDKFFDKDMKELIELNSNNNIKLEEEKNDPKQVEEKSESNLTSIIIHAHFSPTAVPLSLRNFRNGTRKLVPLKVQKTNEFGSKSDVEQIWKENNPILDLSPQKNSFGCLLKEVELKKVLSQEASRGSQYFRDQVSVLENSLKQKQVEKLKIKRISSHFKTNESPMYKQGM